MKKVNKGAVPPKLSTYSASNPNADWDQFRNSPSRYLQVQRTLYTDQKGLCAYCEIDLQIGLGQQSDFRVEHFHSKSPHAPPPNHALDWSNLLGCCHGGSSRNVADPARFTAPDLSCDAVKEDSDWVGVILDPIRDIPAFPRLFEFKESSGAMAPDQAFCPSHLLTQAQASIDNLHLTSNVSGQPNRLDRFRKAVMEKLREEMEKRIDGGMEFADAATELAGIFLPNSAAKWPAFFTCIRWYLGPAAEDRLRVIHFNG